MFFASFAFSEEIEKDDIFLIDDAPFDVHKSKIEEIQNQKQNMIVMALDLKNL